MRLLQNSGSPFRQALHGRLGRDIRNVRVLAKDGRIDVADPLPDDGLRHAAGQGVRNERVPKRVQMALQSYRRLPVLPTAVLEIGVPHFSTLEDAHAFGDQFVALGSCL